MHEETKYFANSKSPAGGCYLAVTYILLISVWCFLRSVGFIKHRVEKKIKKAIMSIQRNQYLLHSYDCSFLASME